MQTPWQTRFAQRTQRMKSSAIRELLKVTEQPDIISFGGGLPAPEVFPVKEFRSACLRVLQDRGTLALQYGTTEGYRPLREMIAQNSQRYGIEITLDNVLITSGSQQALDLLGKILINPGDHILIETPCYLGALQAWDAYGAEYVTVASDKDGMIPESVEEALRAGPKFIYVLPNFENPSGITLSLERRHELVRLADRYSVPIIEDDPYGQLRFEGEHLPPVVVLDSQYRDNGSGGYRGNVIYLSTFSKTLSPGIRLAWVIAPPEVIHRLVMAKQALTCIPQPSPRWWPTSWSTKAFWTSMCTSYGRCIAIGEMRCWRRWMPISPPAPIGRSHKGGCSCGALCRTASTRPNCSRQQ
jgi:2-aminoadipate transaminase